MLSAGPRVEILIPGLDRGPVVASPLNGAGAPRRDDRGPAPASSLPPADDRVAAIRVRLPWAIGVACAVAAAALCVTSLHDFQIHRMADRLLEQSERACANDRPKDALSYLRW